MARSRLVVAALAAVALLAPTSAADGSAVHRMETEGATPPGARPEPRSHGRPGALAPGRRRLVPDPDRPGHPWGLRHQRRAAAARPGRPAGRALPAGEDLGGEGRHRLPQPGGLERQRPHRTAPRRPGHEACPCRAPRPARTAPAMCSPSVPASPPSRWAPAAPCTRRCTPGTVASGSSGSTPTAPRSRIARDTDGMVLPTPDARQVVVAPQSWELHELRLIDGHGHLVRTLPTPRPCTPARWWDAETVLAACSRANGVTRLYAVPLDGSAPRPVSADHGRGSSDLGDIDARRLGGTTYLEASGPCGVVFLARQHGRRHRHPRPGPRQPGQRVPDRPARPPARAPDRGLLRRRRRP